MTNSALTRINEESDNDGSSAHSSNAYEDREAQGGKYGSKIRWQDLNYPLGFHIVHYDHRELNTISSRICRLAHYASIFVYFTLLLNMVDVIALASMSIDPIRILYSFFNIVLIGPVVCLNFCLIFLVLATGKRSYYRCYLALQSLLCILYLVLASLGVGPVNGFTKILNQEKELDGLSSKLR
ncbi:hypothetical protein BgAZ_502830 [Babesia gibsoni]|uniref:Uncharacterized protein n=1 Tax=Babesia gibsoni TaxID=33632 RepID=A0AAD8LMN4_BABGI|nr:hypothetical protein BgAZ_502830 [Babesia gibsoni]